MLQKTVLFICGLLLTVVGVCSAYDNYDAALDGVLPVCRLPETVPVYAQPDEAGPQLWVAEAGSLVTVLSYQNPFKKDDQWWRWFNVAYDLGGKPGTGYICSSIELNNNGFKFDARGFYDYIDKNKAAAVLGRRVDHDALTPAQFRAFQTVMLEDHDEHSMALADSAVLVARSGAGLQNVKLVIDVMVDPEFCAPDYQYYFAWTGEVLLPLFVLLHDTQLDSDWTVDETRTEKYLGDWYDEYVIFPGDGAPDNTIIKVLCTAHKFDDEGWPLDTAYAVEVYAWDGERPVRVPQTAAFKDWRRGE